MTKSSQNAALGIEAVAQRSGLSQHLIRIWERRYSAVQPVRTESNRRLYTEADVDRLALLNRAVRAGHRISDIASISTAKLERLLSKNSPVPAPVASGKVGDESSYVGAALVAIESFDAESLSAILARADVDYGQSRALESIIMPLMEKVGSMWKDGDLRIAHEHMATAVISYHVGSVLANFRYESHAPVIVVATPVGQLHEAGALAVAVIAAVRGWRPIYLGSNLPAEEIAGVAAKSGARAVALSLVYPADDPKLPAELRRLRRLLPDGLGLLIGGRAAEGYRKTIDEIDAAFVSSMGTLKERLEHAQS